jgi:hypothetical protein
MTRWYHSDKMLGNLHGIAGRAFSQVIGYEP